MHSQVIGGQDNGYSSSSQYLGDPVRPSPPPPSVELPHVGIPRHTEIIICGQFPSFAITFNRSIVSSFPTTSSKTFGRYFSTLGGARTRCQKGRGERKESEKLFIPRQLVRDVWYASRSCVRSRSHCFVGGKVQAPPSVCQIARRCKTRLHAFQAYNYSGENTETV